MARGSVFKRGRTWSIRYDAGIDADTGKRKQGFKGGFAAQQEAEAALAIALAEVVQHTHVPSQRVTFADLAEEWMAGATGRPSTRERYAGVLKHRLVPAFGKLKVQDMTPRHIQARYRVWVDEGLRSGTIRTLHARLGQIFSYAYERHYVARNIMDSVRMPKEERTTFEVWTVEQLGAFLAVAGSDPYDRLWRLYGMSGMRRAEALGLRWKDVDLAGNVVRIRQQAVRESGTITLRALKTDRSTRDVLLDGATIRALREQRSWVQEQRMAFRSTWQEHDLVFPFVARRSDAPTQPGEPIGPDTASMAWKAALAPCTLPQIRLHDLRHSHATHLLQAGHPIHVVAQRLGHSPSMLLRTYAHVVQEQRTAITNWLETAFKQA